MEPNARLPQRRALWSLMRKIRGDLRGVAGTHQSCFPSDRRDSDLENVCNCKKTFRNLFTIINTHYHWPDSFTLFMHTGHLQLLKTAIVCRISYNVIFTVKGWFKYSSTQSKCEMWRGSICNVFHEKSLLPNRELPNSSCSRPVTREHVQIHKVKIQHEHIDKQTKKKIKMCSYTANSKGISGLPIYIGSQGLFFSETNSWSSAYRSSIFIRMENESSRNMARRFIVYAVCGQVQIGNQLSN